MVAAGFVLACLVLMPVQALVLLLRHPASDAVPQLFFRIVLALMGARVVVRGEIARGTPLLVTSNHTSYLDIPVIGSVAPLSFIAKRQVRDWPLFGVLAQLDRSVFVDRDSRGRAVDDVAQIKARLAKGETLVLFPEGTSNTGNGVLAFKSALIGAVHYRAEGEKAGPPVQVQPLSVAYTRLHGLPMGRQFRPNFAWYGDMSLIPHLWRVFGIGPFDVELEFHEPVALDAFPSRKALTSHVQEVVHAGVGAALSGRRPEPARPQAEPEGARAPAVVPPMSPAPTA
ncbi:MAG: 1-acyl-sn-glycerol-3-phosphate acyltransferase [Alphaproteobacteria bacterium]|nr:1-acyl-sn-glycerol-3-phosphate acyltransferase [Alphaproteobacteria bacterium]